MAVNLLEVVANVECSAVSRKLSPESRSCSASLHGPLTVVIGTCVASNNELNRKSEQNRSKSRRAYRLPLFSKFRFWGCPQMLYWAAVFFIIAMIVGFMNFGGVVVGASTIAQVLFFTFVILFLVSLTSGLFQRRSY